MIDRRTVRLVLEYDGTDLCGWQRQDNGPTVQEHLETALHRMTGARTPVIGASRTDSGVHALGQVASFETGARIPPRGLRLGLNSILPPAISVVAAEDVPAGFHARFSAGGKHYRYTVWTRSSRSPLLARQSWQVPAPLDVDAMQAAATHLVGEHDFSAFRAAGCSARHPTRRIESLAVTHTGTDRIDIDVRGNAFLRNMVRILVGTLVRAGQGRMTPTQVGEILRGRDREHAGPTAPPHGLCLVEVFYPQLVV